MTTSSLQSNRNHTHIKYLDLALQGGGSHGAYTWGVLDRLLEEPDIEFDGISGTSAGAMNAAVLVTGFESGGRIGARDALNAFWAELSSNIQVNPDFNFLFNPQMASRWNLDQFYAIPYRFFETLTHMSSPYEWNPFNINPLKTLVQKHINVNALLSSKIQLFIAATHVASGQAKVFKGSELSIDSILASACLPQLYQAVEIEGEAYWDGGYMGNPVLWPLIYNTPTHDIMLVQVNPLYRAGVPKRAYEITNRLNEISFNSSLMAEMRAIAFVQDLLKHNHSNNNNNNDDNSFNHLHKAYKHINMHLIEATEAMSDLNASSKVNIDFEFLQHLKHIGRRVTDQWLKTNKSALGHHGTVDIKSKFLGKSPNF